MSNSSSRPRRRKADRPAKPYALFPLTPHAGGKWQKKINGKVCYFGRWGRIVNGKMQRIEGDGWKEALEEYKVQADDRHSGRTPRETGNALTVAELLGKFRLSKLRKLEAGEINGRTFHELEETGWEIVRAFGANRPVDDLRPDDFGNLRARMAKKWGPVRLANAMTRVRSAFKFGIDNGLIERQVRFGSEFEKPAKSVMRRHRARLGPKMFTPDELRKLIDAAPASLRAMILLGVNCGYGNTDCATLPRSALDLAGGWADYPRPKTGIARRCKLWPETVEAIRAALDEQAARGVGSGTGLVFVNERGSPWVHLRGQHRTDNVTVQFGRLVRRLGIGRPGLGFYTLRHVFRTVADSARDAVAIDRIMGHQDPSMGDRYREGVDDARLEAVVNHVRRWLFS